jgi:hypothetical protein
MVSLHPAILAGDFSPAKCLIKSRPILGAFARLAQMWRPLPISPDFPQSTICRGDAAFISGVRETPARRAFQETSISSCTNSGQVAVGGVHLIETQADKVA